MVLLNIEKNFDSVWNDALLHKLIVVGVLTHFVKIVQSFLKNRPSFVVINDKIHIMTFRYRKAVKSEYLQMIQRSLPQQEIKTMSITDSSTAGVNEAKKHFKDCKVKANSFRQKTCSSQSR